jgi:hypothetical protein
VEPRTEQFTVVSSKANIGYAREMVGRWGHAYGVTINGIEERPKRLSVELVITATGSSDALGRFRSEVGGSGIGSGSPTGSPFDALINGLLGEGSKAVRRWRQGRSGG